MSVTRPDLDRHITAWLDAQAPTREPDGLFERVAGEIAHTHRLPGWVIPERWLPMQTTARFGPAARAVTMLALVALALVAFAAIVAAAQPKPAPPVGLARNGLIAFPHAGDIWVVDPDGSDPRRLVSSPGLDGPPLWSPDGRKIAFWSIAFDGDISDASAVEAAVNAGDMSVWVADADGSHERPVLEHVRWSNSCGTDMAWAHDGDRLAVTTLAADASDTPSITIVPLDGGPTRLLVEDGVDAAWSPDDRTIAYHGMIHAGSDGRADLSGVWLVGSDGSNDHRLSETTGAGCAFDGPAWSPDGGRIAFYGQADGDHDIWVAEVDGSGETRIAADIADEYWPRWSPDGTRIAFDRVVEPANNAPRFVVTDPDGADPATLDHPLVSARLPTWSPDGRWILGMLLDDTHTQVIGLLRVDPDEQEPPLIIYEGIVDGDPSWQRLAP